MPLEDRIQALAVQAWPLQEHGDPLAPLGGARSGLKIERHEVLGQHDPGRDTFVVESGRTLDGLVTDEAGRDEELRGNACDDDVLLV